MSPFLADSGFPPSLDGYPILTMLVVMFFWGGTLMCLQWIYAIVSDMIDTPAPRRHPVTVVRWVKLMLLSAALTRTVPRLVLLMTWQKLPEDWREIWALSSWLVLIPWALMFGCAWWLDRAARPIEQVATLRWSATELKPATRIEKRRGIVLLGVIVVIGFATTFIRPGPSHVDVGVTVARGR